MRARTALAAIFLATIIASPVHAGPLGWLAKKAVTVAIGVGIGIAMTQAANADDTLFDQLDVLSDSIDAATEEQRSGRTVVDAAVEIFASGLSRETERACNAEPVAHKMSRMLVLLEGGTPLQERAAIAFEACCEIRHPIAHGVVTSPAFSVFDALPNGKSKAAKVISRLGNQLTGQQQEDLQEAVNQTLSVAGLPPHCQQVSLLAHEMGWL